MQLRSQVNQLLQNMQHMLDYAGREELEELSQLLRDLRGRLDEPLRVAVVGFMKAGKSTLMNALLREKVLFTGNVETTYRVSWFKYGPTPRLEVFFRDGGSQKAPFSDLEKWTVRESVKENPRIDDVSYIVVYYPNDMLKTMELIDTPGLFSTHQKDAQNTMDFLGLKEAEESDRITAQEAARADAIVYAFSRGVQGKDAEILDAFLGGCAVDSTPVNALGIFTKADVYWNPLSQPDENPLDTVAPALDGYRRRLRDKLYNIYPVTAKAVECASEMTDEIWDALVQLAKMEPDVLTDILADAHYFADEPDQDIPLPPATRRNLLEHFGQYGIYSAARLIREGVTRGELTNRLTAVSGVESAAEVIQRHFGNRAFLIKLSYVLGKIRALTARLQRQCREVSGVCSRILEDIDGLVQNEQAFCELKVLQGYYSGDFGFSNSEDQMQFLQLTGENGSSCGAKLGLGAETSIQVLKREALRRSRHWNNIANDFGTEPRVADAATVLVRTCEAFYYHLEMLSGYET